MSEVVPEWFPSMSAAILNGIDEEARPDAEALHAAISSRLATAPAVVTDAVRNGFVAGAMGLTMDSVMSKIEGAPGLDGISAELGGAVDGAKAALLGPLEDALAPLQQSANTLRQVADRAWGLAGAPAKVAATMLKAETTAGALAMITGLPPVTAGWAAATNARQALVLTSESAAKVATGAESAWGSVVRTLDMVRARVFGLTDAVADIANDAIGTITGGVQSEIAGASAAMSGALNDAVVTVIPDFEGLP